ncbi:hypothetical protein K469DRAFT_681326 [Zopfia rhizophila CBS 207.26]|uniref:Ankyrin n=1 Tax=Zopfia rhizophila CBS 207.26 TaxID=1314779 RepID=A0A6A6ETN5_9PEZI|nr:hypothetical protein K469DRAFT_681326 [Zopfia rhizophila CBS 207.26]
MTDILEDVAGSGNLSLVEAAISLGAHIKYRSLKKKTRHRALELAAAGSQRHRFPAPPSKLLDLAARIRADFKPVDYALLDAAYTGHMELAICLLSAHGADWHAIAYLRAVGDKDEMFWPRTVLDGIARMENTERGIGVLKLIMKDDGFSPNHIALTYERGDVLAIHSVVAVCEGGVSGCGGDDAGG